ncbi:MAG: metal ABC transporter ATP-binding protein [Thermoplasmatota archaeon]
MDLLRASGLRAGYGKGPDVLRDVSLALAEGETVAILGPSGGGKSTLAKAVAGLLPLRAGTLEVVGARWPARPAPGVVGYVPQRLGLVRHATALDNVLLGGLHETSTMASLTRRWPADLRRRAEEALGSLGLAHRMTTPVHALSGGEQRRTAVARAIVQRPRLLLADEFLGESDPDTLETVVAAVQRLQRETGMGLLFIEHHLARAQRLADRVLRLDGGVLEPVTGDAEAATPVPAGGTT